MNMSYSNKINEVIKYINYYFRRHYICCSDRKELNCFYKFVKKNSGGGVFSKSYEVCVDNIREYIDNLCRSRNISEDMRIVFSRIYDFLSGEREGLYYNFEPDSLLPKHSGELLRAKIYEIVHGIK